MKFGRAMLLAIFLVLGFCDEGSLLAQAPAEPDLVQQKQAEEIRKLREEIRALEQDNRLRESGGTVLYWASGLSGLIGGAFALVLALLGNFLTRTYSESQRDKTETERRKLDQEREPAREQHNLELLKGLGSDNPRFRLAATSVLLERIAQIAQADDPRERRYLIEALVAVTKERDPDEPLNKAIGDGIVRALGAVRTECSVSGTSPLATVDLQKSCLRNVYWRSVDLRGIDLFRVDLSDASLRAAHLQGAVLYETCLRNAVLRGARLAGANLREANLQAADLREADLTGADLCGADLTGARLDGAILADIASDAKTLWPERHGG